MVEDRNYYVYALIDPRNNLPFYIGKGKMTDKLNRKYRRIKEHFEYVDKGNQFKTHIIKKLQKAGTPATYQIIQENLTEVESFSLEIELIKKYGKRINKTGILTNITDGGEGGSGNKWSEHAKEQQSIRLKEWNKNNDNSFKGKKHTVETCKIISEKNKKYWGDHANNMLGKRHSEATKEVMRIKMKQRGCVVPKEKWFIFGSPAEKNSQAKKYIFITPEGKEIKVHGQFKLFIKENNLSLGVFKNMCDKGVIPEPKNKNHNRMSQERLNSTGWEVKYDIN